MRVIVLMVLLAWSGAAYAGDLREPSLHIAKGGDAHPQVALTLDACSGATDLRILSTLVDHHIPATIFITGRWLANNAEAAKVLTSHPELFELENHGARHIPAVLGNEPVYGIKPAGTIQAITAEIQDGAADLVAATGAVSHWYRDATARYSPDAIDLIGALGYRVAGYSINGDYGASVLAPAAARQISNAKDGDVIIAHINQPKRHAGEGVAEGILALKARGFTFVKLDDVKTFGGDGRD
jgi:peptidoglycan/xylan/chitin deacetylase (PgdA/CDA1 family)